MSEVMSPQRRGAPLRRVRDAALAVAPRPRWNTRELTTIGVFATVIKASAIMLAYMGGGMNPITLALKNCLYVTLMLVLLHKVPRLWTLPLAVGVTSLVSLLLMGQGILLAPAALAAALLGEAVIRALGGYGRTRALVAGILTAELSAKALGLGLSWLSMREQPGMLITAAVFICIGASGTVMGCFAGLRFMKELRHAGLIVH
ncbi:MAG: MptD family putative ECF transporter S component [Deltaproteobacteria bacterium]|jgi:energy-coupling factor transport system substrate-specific component|nr:MptD family putative ECF transporter S component [Deltaproteobacteria bacterium]